MRTWLLKRLLVFIPTLFLIALVVFGVVNAVPAAPLSIDVEAEHNQFRESYRVFRAQFGLGHPVFLNFRHATSAEDVRALLQRALGGEENARRQAEERLADLGRHAVPGLIEAAGDAGAEAALRDLALALLPEGARQPIEPGEEAGPRRWKNEENALVARLSAGGPAASAAEREQRAAAWRAWLAERAERFAPGLLERARVTFLETRFAVYLRNLLHLDFGVSMADQQPVLPTLLGRLGNSFLICFLSIFLSYLLAVPLGVASAVLRGRRAERALAVILFALYSLPTYFAATLLLHFFSVGEPFDWFPSGRLHSGDGYEELALPGRLLDRAHHLVLPVFCLTYAGLAILSRYARNSLLEVLRADFVRTARAKGLCERAVLFRHALRNALLPLITLLGNVLPAVFSGAVIIEIIFDIPGMGSYIFDAILMRDYNVIMATTLIAAVLTLVGFLLADLACAAADPRLSLAGGREGAR
ncbi:MAG: ABC transporter permease [Planctomycetes bacterium]|nr:ABC transporter permease [Planctomycetota bacterium]